LAKTGDRRGRQIVKVSFRGILILTAIVCFQSAIPSTHDHLAIMAACFAAVMFFVFPFVLFGKWSIDDKDGWWKFAGNRFTRVAVWIYSLSLCHCAIGFFRLIVLDMWSSP
jgi:hypothetical protein